MAFKRCYWHHYPTPLHHHHRPEPLRQGRMDPCFHVLYAKFWPYHLNFAGKIKTHQTRQRFFPIAYCLFLQSSSLHFLFLVDRSGTRCGLLLLEPICFRVRRVVRSEMVFCIPWLWRVFIWVTVSFLSSLTSLPILLWPLTSTRHFRPHNCLSLEIYCFSDYSL